MRLARTRYAGANHTHLSELLSEREGIDIGRTTLRRILVNAGLSSPRRRRPPQHRVRRQRMPREGMLIQLDGSHRQWLGHQAPPFTLLIAVDDATGTVVDARFSEREDAHSYFLLMQGVKGQVETGALGGLLCGFDSAAALAGLLGGEADDGEYVGGEGAGLALGFSQTPRHSLQGGAHAAILAGGFMAGPLVGLGDGGRGKPQRRDAGAGTGAGGQVSGHGEGLRRQGREADLVAPAGEDSPLGLVDAPGVVGEDGLHGLGDAPVGGAQRRRGWRLLGNDLRMAVSSGHDGSVGMNGRGG